MENKIKVGIEFECIQDYVMDDGSIAFIKGKKYKVNKVEEFSNWFYMNSEYSVDHKMSINDEFWEDFVYYVDDSFTNGTFPTMDKGRTCTNIELVVYPYVFATETDQTNTYNCSIAITYSR